MEMKPYFIANWAMNVYQNIKFVTKNMIANIKKTKGDLKKKNISFTE